MINKLKVDLSKTFDMKDLEDAKHILDMQITRDRESKKFHTSHSTNSFSISVLFMTMRTIVCMLNNLRLVILLYFFCTLMIC